MPHAKTRIRISLSSTEATTHEPKYDQSNGWGAMPNNAEVHYLGMEVMMRPSKFLELALPLGISERHNESAILEHMRQGGSIGSPWLQLDIQRGNDGLSPNGAKIEGHEGRNRMLAAQKLWDDRPVKVHITGHSFRARNLTETLIQELRRGVVGETGTWVRGPLWA